MAWPGKLTLTDKALYFEVFIIFILMSGYMSIKHKERGYVGCCDFVFEDKYNEALYFLQCFLFYKICE